VNYDGSLHKCGVDADTDSRSVGTVNGLLDITNENVRYWSEYEPVADPTCRECRALPVCLGGCARDRREDRHEAMARNCMVHLKHEPEIISQHVRIRREKTQRADGI